MPVKIADEPAAGDTQDAAGTANAPQGGPGAANSANQAAANASAVLASGSAANTGASSAASQTPLAELSQLDETLQQMGVDPQSISLFNRMAMVLYANDPAALRVLVQTLQTGAQLATASTDDSGSAASASQTTASTLQSLLPGQTGASQQEQTAAAQSQNASMDSQVEAIASQQTPDSQQTAVGQTGQNQDGTGKGSTIDAMATATTADLSVAPTASEPNASSLSLQLEELQFAFAAVGAQQLASGEDNSQGGQVLNVTA